MNKSTQTNMDIKKECLLHYWKGTPENPKYCLKCGIKHKNLYMKSTQTNWEKILETYKFEGGISDSVYWEVYDLIKNNVIQSTRKELIEKFDGIVDIVIGYMGDETEYEAAQNRWKILKDELSKQSIKESKTK